jgi:hypothetical protein
LVEAQVVRTMVNFYLTREKISDVFV